MCSKLCIVVDGKTVGSLKFNIILNKCICNWDKCMAYEVAFVEKRKMEKTSLVVVIKLDWISMVKHVKL